MGWAGDTPPWRLEGRLCWEEAASGVQAPPTWLPCIPARRWGNPSHAETQLTRLAVESVYRKRTFLVNFS